MTNETKAPRRIWYEPVTEFAWPQEPDHDDANGLPTFEYARVPSEEEIEAVWEKHRSIGPDNMLPYRMTHNEFLAAVRELTGGNKCDS